ncbi:alpha/beta hydrolase [Planctomyces sp. SH-PL62]|uniref:alpha/beta hydrolase n=1 Tax=Planctomyces sp. SH-PL62 TaxID=1636152 RepID=UPI00078EF275|nr:alpha/beta hydrolase [Planctomyces sp. SH-PL62]AMV37640.1 Lipase 2 [Planctomyces sp. SH-PL62]
MPSTLLLLVLSAAAWADDVVVRKDIPYLGPDRAEKLDLYLPAADPKDGEERPGIVIIHGGGWTGGDKGARREIEIGTTLAQHGYVCVSIDYALAKKGSPTWPGNLKDCKRAVQWLRKHAEEYHVDADRIGAIGGSAGGHLTAMLALTGPDDGFEPEEDPDVSTRIQAAAPMYAHMAAGFDGDHAMFPARMSESPDLYRLAAPIAHVTKDDPPILLLHGTADTTTPLFHSERLAAKLQEVGVPHQLVIVEGAPHSFALRPRQRDLRALVIGFFDEHLKPAKDRE